MPSFDQSNDELPRLSSRGRISDGGGSSVIAPSLGESTRRPFSPLSPLSPTSPTSPTSPQGPISPPSEEDWAISQGSCRALPSAASVSDELSGVFDDAPILHLSPGSVYHAFRPPSQNGAHARDAHAITPSTTPPPNTPALIDNLRLRSTSKNPIATPIDKPGSRLSVEIGPAAPVPMPTASPSPSGVCYVCKQRVFDKEGVSFRNVLVAVSMDGITVAKPFSETVLHTWRWRVIKQWSWNPVSFIVRLDTGGRADQDVHFETAQADEILAAINYYVTLNLQALKKEKEAEQLARSYAAVNNTPYKPPPKLPPGGLAAISPPPP